MKTRPNTPLKKSPAAENPSRLPEHSSVAKLESWLAQHQSRILIGLVLIWLAIRLSMFLTITQGPLFEMYRWPASDNYFFDEWARKLAAGDWLNRAPIHPYHDWHQAIADAFFKQHPEQLQQIMAANPGQDSTFVPGKVLWQNWYHGNTYHQEPLYAYVLAAFYAFSGQGVYGMMILQALLGIGSGVLLWLLTRRHFGHVVALVSGIFYFFCGIVLFQESLLLRTSWIVFFVLLTLFTFENALEKRTLKSFLHCGLSIGFAFMVQSTFLLFLLGALGIYGWKERRNKPVFARNAGGVMAGFMLIYTPVMLRNHLVGASLFSVSSVGAITFAASNLADTKTISTWMPDAPGCADILVQSGGDFLPTIAATISTHRSAGSYFQLIWSKFTHVINGAEWPNNENYYFYKQLVPALDFAFINFYWIIGLGMAGIIWALYQRRSHTSLFLALAIQLSILLGFYVLGRFRCPLAVLLLPFAAYMLVECLRFSRFHWKESCSKIILTCLCIWMFSLRFYQPGISRLDATDYTVFYELNFFEKIKQNAEAGRYSEAIAAHKAFLDYQPDFVKNAHLHLHKIHPSDANLLYLFAEHYMIHSYLFEDSGNKSMAAQWRTKYETMKRLADAVSKTNRR